MTGTSEASVPIRDAAVRGVAVRDAARAGARGRVASLHRRAVYLDLDGALIALVSGDVESGPLHLRSGPLPPATAGERVTCDGSRIAGRTWAVRCDVTTWEGALPTSWSRDRAGHAAQPDGAGRPTTEHRTDVGGSTTSPAGLWFGSDGGSTTTASDSVAVAGPTPQLPGEAVRWRNHVVDRDGTAGRGGVAERSDEDGRGGTVERRGALHSSVEPARSAWHAIPDDVPVDPGAVHDATRRGAVEELAGLLGGQGPGLTPAGDDLLAGIVLVARAMWGTAAEARLEAAVAGVRTTRPAAAFLHWAARGQSLAPAHDVLVALAAGRRDEPAERRLSAIGASSGACLLAGLRIGAAQLPRLDTRSTRAGSDVAL